MPKSHLGHMSLAWDKLILDFLVHGQMSTTLLVDEMSSAAAAAEVTSLALLSRWILEQQLRQCLLVISSCIGSLKL